MDAVFAPVTTNRRKKVDTFRTIDGSRFHPTSGHKLLKDGLPEEPPQHCHGEEDQASLLSEPGRGRAPNGLNGEGVERDAGGITGPAENGGRSDLELPVAGDLEGVVVQGGSAEGIGSRSGLQGRGPH